MLYVHFIAENQAATELSWLQVTHCWQVLLEDYNKHMLLSQCHEVDDFNEFLHFQIIWLQN